MRRWRHWIDDERGSASLEFITAGMILLVPTVYLVLALSSLQAAGFAAEGAARQGARVFVTAETVGEAQAQLRRAVEFAMADQGIDSDRAAVTIACAPSPSDCLAPESMVTVTVDVLVALPLVPAVLDLDTAASVPIQAVAAQQVSRFGAAR